MYVFHQLQKKWIFIITTQHYLMVVDINKSMYFLGIYGFFWPRKKDDVRCSKAIDSLENEYVGMYSVSKMEFSIPICFEQQVWKIQAL